MSLHTQELRISFVLLTIIIERYETLKNTRILNSNTTNTTNTGTLDKIAHRERSLSVDLQRIMTRSMNLSVVEKDDDDDDVDIGDKLLISKEEFLENFVSAWEVVCDVKDDDGGEEDDFDDELKSLIAPILLMGSS